MAGAKQLAFDAALALGQEIEQFEAMGAAQRSRDQRELLERLADAAGLTLSNASQHLRQLRRAGLVARRKIGTQVIYALADDAVIALLRSLWHVTERNVAELERVVRRYYRDRDGLEPVSRDELQARLKAGSVVAFSTSVRRTNSRRGTCPAP